MLAFCTVAYSRICGLFAKKYLNIYGGDPIYVWFFEILRVFNATRKKNDVMPRGKEKKELAFTSPLNSVYFSVKKSIAH